MAKNKEKSDKSFPIHLLFLTDNYQLLSESHYFGRIFFSFSQMPNVLPRHFVLYSASLKHKKLLFALK